MNDEELRAKMASIRWTVDPPSPEPFDKWFKPIEAYIHKKLTTPSDASEKENP